jgi:hypothetical protein
MPSLSIIKGKVDQVKYKIAQKKDLDRLLRVPEEPEVFTLVLDEKENIIVELHVKQPTVIATQRLMESFVSTQKKKAGETEDTVKFKLIAYYKAAWKEWVAHTNPKMGYRDIKYYHADFNQVLNEIFPSPFDLFKEGSIMIDEEEEKN